MQCCNQEHSMKRLTLAALVLAAGAAVAVPKADIAKGKSKRINKRGGKMFA